ncbi:hypothetical protein DENSPDRAFT_886851 [Dentipellis sp. KUC8613]|nr:hypothetical protein DENSPDRAFT_886851 [Dentipellis sp. KUC8613]
MPAPPHSPSIMPAPRPAIFAPHGAVSSSLRHLRIPPHRLCAPSTPCRASVPPPTLGHPHAPFATPSCAIACFGHAPLCRRTPFATVIRLRDDTPCSRNDTPPPSAPSQRPAVPSARPTHAVPPSVRCLHAPSSHSPYRRLRPWSSRRPARLSPVHRRCALPTLATAHDALPKPSRRTTCVSQPFPATAPLPPSAAPPPPLPPQ